MRGGKKSCSHIFRVILRVVPIYYRVMPSNLPSGNGTEGAVVCTDLGRQLRPQFYFLWVSLMASLCIFCD